MNYERIYNALIDRARNCLCHGDIEGHHIVPKCMGGSNNENNIVQLRPEEHYLAHLLLVKIYPDNYKLLCAANIMTRGGRANIRMNNKLYSWIKKRRAILMSEIMKGRPCSETTKAKIAEANSKKIRTQAEKDHLSEINTGKKNPKSSAKKIGKTAYNKGVAMSDEQKEKLRLYYQENKRQRIYHIDGTWHYETKEKRNGTQ